MVAAHYEVGPHHICTSRARISGHLGAEGYLRFGGRCRSGDDEGATGWQRDVVAEGSAEWWQTMQTVAAMGGALAEERWRHASEWRRRRKWEDCLVEAFGLQW